MRINGLFAKTLATLVLSVFMTGSAFAWTEKFKSEDLLEFPKGQKDTFYAAVFMSIGHLLSHQGNKSTSECVLNWYKEDTDKRIAEIEEMMAQYKKHAPTSIMIGLAQRECGKF